MSVLTKVNLAIIKRSLEEIFDDNGEVDVVTEDSIYRLHCVEAMLNRFVFTKLSDNSGKIQPGEEIRVGGWNLVMFDEHVRLELYHTSGTTTRTSNVKSVNIVIEEPS